MVPYSTVYLDNCLLWGLLSLLQGRTASRISLRLLRRSRFGGRSCDCSPWFTLTFEPRQLRTPRERSMPPTCLEKFLVRSTKTVWKLLRYGNFEVTWLPLNSKAHIRK